jgi:DNA-binding transcriptional MerR regulator
MPLPFLKKKEESFAVPKITPSDRVKELAGKGFSEPEIIEILRKEGYRPEEIDRALTESLKTTVSPPPKPLEEKPQIPTLPTLEELIPPPKKEEKPEVPETSLPEGYYEYPIEDYVDTLIQARLSEVDEKIKEFSIKYGEMEKRLSSINEQLNELIKARPAEQQQLIQKVEGITESVNELSIRLGNLEKAFKEALPALIESVRALSDIVHKLKSSA